MAHPGTLPAVNKEAVKKLLMVGAAVEGELASFSEFDRKNYFYPDIPKAYQLSQYQFPFVKGGELAGVELTRIHLEEDTARSQHDSASIVDFNRAGVPLMELVTEPVIHDSKTAVAFAKELQLLLKTLGVSDANMERGEMRVEANISISDTKELGTKVEVKNLNSFKAMEQAIKYEYKRQCEMLEKGEKIKQETRGWDENRNKTFSQRSKETAEDYRYFPDPDIPKMDLSKTKDLDKSRIAEILPKTPKYKRIFYSEIFISEQQTELIIADRIAEEFFLATLQFLGDDRKAIQLAANYLTSDLFALIEENEARVLSGESAEYYAKLITMLVSGKINSRIAKDILLQVVFEKRNPEQLAEESGLLQVSDEDTLLKVVDDVLKEHKDVAVEYKAGKEASLKFLIGQCMKVTKGSGNPEILAELLKKRLS